MKATPSVSDAEPLGGGGPNRHGMPKLPIGQHPVEKWPVLDLGHHPAVPLERWTLRIDGAVENAVTLSWNDFIGLHCVTTWSKMDMAWVGVRFADVAALARPSAGASHAMGHAYDGYSTNIALVEALEPDVLLAHRVDGIPLAREHGGPVRMITPQLYAWKGAKWIERIEWLEADSPGFWEQRGYSMTAYPWRDDRYS